MTHSKETKEKMRAAHLGRHHSKKTKEKIHATMQARFAEARQTNAELKAAGFSPIPLISPRQHSEETKAKIRTSAKGRKFSAKAYAALATWRKEKKESAQELKVLYREGILFKPKKVHQETEEQKWRKQLAVERRLLKQRMAEKERQDRIAKNRAKLFNSKKEKQNG